MLRLAQNSFLILGVPALFSALDSALLGVVRGVGVGGRVHSTCGVELLMLWRISGHMSRLVVPNGTKLTVVLSELNAITPFFFVNSFEQSCG